MSKKGVGLLFLIFLTGIVLSVSIRTVLILFYIDSSTGFYSKSTTLSSTLNIILITVTVLLLAPLVFKSLHNLDISPKPSRAISVFSGMLALSMALDAASQLFRVLLTYSGAGDFFAGIIEILAAIFFFMFAVASYSGSQPIVFPYSALFPALWAVIHLMVSFMHYTMSVNVSEYIYDMLKMVFIMIFFYYHARYAGRVKNGRELNGMLAFGLPTVMFCLVSTLPRYIAYFAGKTLSSSSYTDDLVSIILSVYIIATLIKIMMVKQHKKTVEDATA